MARLQKLLKFCQGVMLAALFTGSSACGDAYVTLTVEDPQKLAGDADILAVGEKANELQSFPMQGQGFPLTQTQVGDDGDKIQVWVEARKGKTTLARGRTQLQFDSSRTGSATVSLASPCDEDAACDDGVFANGAETCVDRVCVNGSAPCASAVACVEVTVVEENGGYCDPHPNHDLCDPVELGNGQTVGTFCDALNGCIPGDACAIEDEGEECPHVDPCSAPRVCTAGRCVPQGELVVDDDNPCTVDVCVPGMGPDFIPDQTVNGNVCTTDTDTLGICLSGLCVQTMCGDGFRDADEGEECDAGAAANSDTEPDACRTDCTKHRCGDNVVDLLEGCDDGNTVSDDGCSALCVTEFCGDGTTQAGINEACDDGNQTSGDGCSSACVVEFCGDGVIQPDLNEICDDGNTVSDDGCSALCVTEFCGDGTTQAGINEACDDGNQISGDGCSSACVVEFCGDGVVQSELNEVCDDGNDVETDDCLDNCQRASCGDNVIWAGMEECDDGNDVDSDACLSTCIAAKCGDGVVQLSEEECDDGNSEDQDRCKNDCSENICGDGVTDLFEEECDDNNSDDNDHCLTNCVKNVCGDAIVNNLAESCDDGNGILTDDCLPNCELNICGDGIRNFNAESCDDGNLTSLDGCGPTCNFLAWSVDLGTPIAPNAAPVSFSLSTGGKVVAVTTISGDVVALSALSGVERWRFSSGKTTTAGAIAGSNGVFLLTDDGTLFALDFDGPATANQPRWQVSLPRPTNGSRPSLSAGVNLDRVVVVDGEGALHQFFSNTGDPAPWNIPSVSGPYTGSTAPRDHYDGGYSDVECTECVATVTNGLQVLNNGSNFGIGGLLVPLTDSVWLWQMSQGGCDPLVVDLGTGINVVGEVIYRGNNSYTSQGEPAYAITSDGALMRWNSNIQDAARCDATLTMTHRSDPTAPFVTSPVVINDPNSTEDLIVVADGDNQLHVLKEEIYGQNPPPLPHAFTSLFGWPFQALGALRVPPVVGLSYRVFAADDAGNLYAINLLSGELIWQETFTGSPAGSPLVSLKGVFLATQGGQVYAFERGDDVGPISWWSRQGANAKGSSHTPACSHLNGTRGSPALWALLLLGFFFRRRRR